MRKTKFAFINGTHSHFGTDCIFFFVNMFLFKKNFVSLAFNIYFTALLILLFLTALNSKKKAIILAQVWTV